MKCLNSNFSLKSDAECHITCIIYPLNITELLRRWPRELTLPLSRVGAQCKISINTFVRLEDVRLEARPSPRCFLEQANGLGCLQAYLDVPLMQLPDIASIPLFKRDCCLAAMSPHSQNGPRIGIPEV